MIAKVKLLKNIGKFYNYSAKGDELDWHKNTFLFAPNAYGKSTLVNVFISLRDNDPKVTQSRKTLNAAATDLAEAVIIIDGVNHVFNGNRWGKPFSAIQIFDMPFIHANILSQEIEHQHRKNWHRAIIGAAGIKLAEELAELKAADKAKRQQLDGFVKQFKEGGFSHHDLDAFPSIPTAEEAAVAPRIQKLEQDIKSKESEIQVRGMGFPRALSAPDFDLSPMKRLAAQKLAVVHETAEKRVLEHIDRNIKDKDQAKEFIRRGLDLVQADCPFCGQDLNAAADLLQAYREFFDDAFRTYQNNLKENTETLANWNIENDLTALVSPHNVNTATLKQWEPFVGAETLPDAAAIVEAARTKLTDLKVKVQAELEKKRKDPNADADPSQFDALSVELASLEADVNAYNGAVTAFTEKAKDYVANLPKSDVDSIRLAVAKEREIEKRFKPEWKKWATDYLAAKKDANDLPVKKDAKQNELETYTKTIFNTYQKRINDLLVTLGADFIITDLKGKTDERASEAYSDFGFLILKKKVPLTAPQDAPCFKNTLSEGDKSTLAFAFFIASLEKTPALDKQIVILDDPLSSLDETRREATTRVLLNLSPKLSQLCVFTHKKDFLRMMFDKIPANTVLQVRSDKTNGSWLEPFDVEEDRKGEYARMVEDMVRYVAEDFGPTPDTMQGNIRKVFEIVLKTKYYRTLAPDIKARKSGFAKLLQTLFDAKLLDPSLKDKLFDVCNMTNDPHHGDIVDAPSMKLTRDELIPLIREALDLLEKV